jgi:hypothetical protein
MWEDSLNQKECGEGWSYVYIDKREPELGFIAIWRVALTKRNNSVEGCRTQ